MPQPKRMMSGSERLTAYVTVRSIGCRCPLPFAASDDSLSLVIVTCTVPLTIGQESTNYPDPGMCMTRGPRRRDRSAHPVQKSNDVHQATLLPSTHHAYALVAARCSPNRTPFCSGVCC